jgi:hypothetical protein
VREAGTGAEAKPERRSSHAAGWTQAVQRRAQDLFSSAVVASGQGGAGHVLGFLANVIVTAAIGIAALITGPNVDAQSDTVPPAVSVVVTAPDAQLAPLPTD